MTKPNKIRVRSHGKLTGTVSVSGDKSLSHRALIFGALAAGKSEIRGWLPAGDTLATLDCIQKLGVTVERHDNTTLTVHGRGLHGLQAPSEVLNCVHAGTAIRLLAGVMAGQAFPSVLDGSEQLRRRPMRRVTEPLRLMGAIVEDMDGKAPLRFSPTTLKGIIYEMPMASAQVKSCLLLAGLFAEGETTIIEPGPARDHTERMLSAMGATLMQENHTVRIQPNPTLRALNLTIPGDPSSAAFLLVAGSCIPDAEITITGVGINETRVGILEALQEMGGQVDIVNVRDEGGEPTADLRVKAAPLEGMTIEGELVVRMIDEFPILMVGATQSVGETWVRNAEELRVKETDRIAVMANELRKLGAVIEETPDGFKVQGRQLLRGAVVNGHDDHRVAMSLVIAGLLADGETLVEEARCVEDSFPTFVEALQALGADVTWED